MRYKQPQLIVADAIGAAISYLPASSVNLATQQIMLLNGAGGMAKVVTKYGLATAFTGFDTGGMSYPGVGTDARDAYTYIFYGSIEGAGSGYARLYSGESSGSLAQSYFDGASLVIENFSNISISPSTTPICLVVVANKTSLDVYIDGALRLSTSRSLVAYSNICLFNRSSDFARQFQGRVGCAAWMPHALNLNTAKGISTNPWQIFKGSQNIALLKALAGASSNISASGAGVASGSANLATQVALAAVGVSLVSGSASPSVAIPLSAAGISVAAGSASAKATVNISAAGLAQAAASAGLSADVLRQAAGAAQAAGNATLAVQLNALAAGAAQAAGSANLAGGALGAISATGQAQAAGNATPAAQLNALAGGAAQAAGNATLAAQFNAVAAGGAQASGSANLAGGALGAISATGQAQSAGSAVLSITIQLQATGAAQAAGTAAGNASAPGALSAAGQAAAAGWGTISTLVTLTAAGFVHAMGAGSFSASIPLAAAGTSVAGGSAAATLVGLVRNFRLVAAAPVRVTRAALGEPKRLINIRHEVRHGA